MRKFLIVILLAIGVVSCYHENKPEVVAPDNLFNEDTLVAILTDIQIAEGIITQQRLQRVKSNKGFKDTIYLVLLKKYNITLKQLNENLDYYNTDPEFMEDVLDRVLENLSKKQAEIQIEATRKDSVNRSQEE